PFVAELQRCEVLSNPVGELIAPLAAVLNGLSIRSRVPQIEVAVTDEAVALVLRVLQPPSTQDHEALREFAARHGVRFYLQSGGLESVRALDEGGEALRYRLRDFDRQLQFTPTDFVQINGQVNEALVTQAVQMLDLTPQARVLDLFCGIGNFTLALARRAGEV